MNKGIRIFEHDNFGAIRVIDRDGEPWFIAKDICNSLGIANTPDAVNRLDEDERNTIVLNDGTPGNPGKTIVSESGLYNLIIRSDKPEAKAFRRWVTHEVLPSIRKHGAYMTGDILAQIKANPRAIGKLILDLANEQDKREELEAREEIWVTRTPWGEISERTGKPRMHAVRGYPRSLRRDPEYIITTTVTETQLRLFNPYEWE